MEKDELIKIVGADNILDDPESLSSYSRDLSFTPPRKPNLVVKPGNSDEVQKIVAWANVTRTTLIPVSSGPPHFRGDTIPITAGTIIVDLTRMNNVIRVDRRNRITIIEPGVTYKQLQPELAKAGMRLSAPLLPRQSKSVVTSLLEREPILTPKYQWTLLEPLRCLEIIWGNGVKMWTGEAGEYASMDLEQQYKKKRAAINPYGPGFVDYYRLVSGAQGTMGIVTWASVKCEILPRIHKYYFIPAKDIRELVGFTYEILKFRLGDEILLLNQTNLSSMLREKENDLKIDKKGLPPWVLVIGIAGREMLPAERVAYQEKGIADIAQRHNLQFVSSIPGIDHSRFSEALQNCSGEPYWKLEKTGGCQDIFFLTTLNNVPAFLDTIFSFTAGKVGFPVSQIGVYIQPQQQGTTCHCEFNIFYNPASSEEALKAQSFFLEASQDLSKKGAYFSRPYGIWSDLAFSKDGPTTILLKKVKNIFDSNNIMNPGKLCF